MLRAIYAFHRYVNGWNDIGYNFVIDLYGRVFEARAGGIEEPVVGAHAGGYNLVSTGVAVLGTFIEAPISPAARAALERAARVEAFAARVPAARKGGRAGQPRRAPSTAASPPARMSRCRGSRATATATPPTAPATPSMVSCRHPPAVALSRRAPCGPRSASHARAARAPPVRLAPSAAGTLNPPAPRRASLAGGAPVAGRDVSRSARTVPAARGELVVEQTLSAGDGRRRPAQVAASLATTLHAGSAASPGCGRGARAPSGYAAAVTARRRCPVRARRPTRPLTAAKLPRPCRQLLGLPRVSPTSGSVRTSSVGALARAPMHGRPR